MKEPQYLEFKKWLVKNAIVGLTLHRAANYQTGTDTSDTDWELTAADGSKKRVKSHTVCTLVTLNPDWYRVLHPKPSVVKEVEEYSAFARKESRDLSEYKRLKAKFEGATDE